MRKDVKIGVGIGGVLLAVLIVYLLVPKNDATPQYSQTDSASTTTDGANVTRDTSSQEPVTTGGNPTGGGTTTGERETPAPTRGGAGGETAETEADAEGGAERGGVTNVDWKKILDTGIVEATPLLATRPPAVTDDPFAESQRMPPTDNGPEPTWTDGRTPQQRAVVPGATGATGQAPSQLPTTPTAPPGVVRTGLTEHVVQQNETLSSISLAAYGDAKYYKEILKANPTLDERKMRPGTKLKLPDPSTFKAAQTAEHRQAAVPLDAKSEYRVGPNDNLHRIAMKLYGKAGKADELYELNKDKIGPDRDRLKQGMVLKLREAPSNQSAANR